MTVGQGRERDQDMYQRGRTGGAQHQGPNDRSRCRIVGVGVDFFSPQLGTGAPEGKAQA